MTVQGPPFFCARIDGDETQEVRATQRRPSDSQMRWRASTRWPSATMMVGEAGSLRLLSSCPAHNALVTDWGSFRRPCARGPARLSKRDATRFVPLSLAHSQGGRVRAPQSATWLSRDGRSSALQRTTLRQGTCALRTRVCTDPHVRRRHHHASERTPTTSCVILHVGCSCCAGCSCGLLVAGKNDVWS